LKTRQKYILEKIRWNILEKKSLALVKEYFLIHQPYGDVEGAKAEGKIHFIGVSNMSVALWNKFVPHGN
jgi:diketogulonate reductase-like aldo/keto reductase